MVKNLRSEPCEEPFVVPCCFMLSLLSFFSFTTTRTTSDNFFASSARIPLVVPCCLLLFLLSSSSFRSEPCEEHIRANSCHSWLKIYVPSPARNLLLFYVVLVVVFFFYDNQDNIGQLFCEFCEDSSLCLCQEIADSSLRNAPTTVSRASTSFRDDCRGGLSVFCCTVLVVVFFFPFRAPRGLLSYRVVVFSP